MGDEKLGRTLKKGTRNFASGFYVTTYVDLLLKVKVNTIHLMKNRGFSIPPDEANLIWENYDNEYTTVRERFIDRYSTLFGPSQVFSVNKLNQFYTSSSGERVMIYFIEQPDKDKVLSDFIERALTEILNHDAKSKLSYVVMVSPTPLIHKASRLIIDSSVQIVLMYYDNFLTNPLSSSYYQKHEKLTEAEKTRLYTDHSLNKSLIPMMPVNDPVSFFNGWKVGDVIRITRDNVFTKEIARDTVSYRVVM